MDALVNIIYKFLFRITAVNNDLSGFIDIKTTSKTVNLTVGSNGITMNVPTVDGYRPFLAIFVTSWGNQDIPYASLSVPLAENQTTFQFWVESTSAITGVPFTYLVLYTKIV